MLMVIVIISILATLLLPTLAKATARARRTACLSNLKQIGIGFHSFAHEHNNLFPMQVSTNDGGSLEFLRAATNFPGDSYFAYRHFQALANELGTPRVLRCPADSRSAAENFRELKNENVSYFLGANAQYTRGESILAGDRTLTRLGPAYGSILYVMPESPIEWAAGLHPNSGNLLFADAHAETCTKAEARMAVAQAGKVSMFFNPMPLPAYLGQASSGTASNAAATGLFGKMEEIFGPGTATQTGRNRTNTNPRGPGAGVVSPTRIVPRETAGGGPGQTQTLTPPTTPVRPGNEGEVNEGDPNTSPPPKISLERVRRFVATFSSGDHYWLLLLLLAMAAALEMLRRHLRRRQRVERAGAAGNRST